MGRGRSILAFMVLEKLLATQLTPLALPESGTVLRANPYLQAVVHCVVPLCSYRVWTESRVLVSSLCQWKCEVLREQCGILGSLPCQGDFDGSREKVVSPAYGSQHTVKLSLSRSTCTQKNDVCSVTVIHYFLDVRLEIFYWLR